MPVTASEIFHFIQRHPEFKINRCEIDSLEFGLLRRCVRQIVARLKESGDPEATDLSDSLRTLLSGWLTVPIKFDEPTFAQLSRTVGSIQTATARWGGDIGDLYRKAMKCADELAGRPNPLRERLREVIAEAKSSNLVCRIYCHRAAAEYFLEFADAQELLHSAASYRDASPFDLMIKVGPLRSRGWGSAPDAILSAPRYSTLAQLVWAGCSDEEGFGYDPAVAVAPNAAGQEGIRTSTQKRVVTVSREGSGQSHEPDAGETSDEFQLFREMLQPRDLRRATLVQISDESGILYPPLSRVISFDVNPDEVEPVAKRLVDEDLAEGMYLVRYATFEPNGSEVHAEHGHYSRIWKAELQRQLDLGPGILLGRLKSAGIHLEGLSSALRHWVRAPTTVIHAPQKRSHFEILIYELRLEQRHVDQDRTAWRRAWWQRAWAEIAASRGVAIQAGVHGQEALEEELLKALKTMLPQIHDGVLNKGGSFSMEFPGEAGINGVAFLDRVVSIERGFEAPDGEMRVVHDIGVFEQWRA